MYIGVIYQVINIQNRKSYIGKTTNKEPLRYINDHFENAFYMHSLKKGKVFYKAIRKYGKDNFKIIILGKIESKTKKELNEKLNQAEIDCIYHFRTFGSNGNFCDYIYGYNMTKGGGWW